MRLYRCLLSLLLGLALAGPVVAAGLDNRLWNELLSRHVRVLEGGHASQVDYVGMAAEREQLRAYLDQVAAVRPAAFARWSEDEQLAISQAGSIFSVNPEDAAAGRASMEDINDTLRLMVQSTINSMQADGYVDVKSGNVHTLLDLAGNTLKLNGKVFETEPEPESNEADLLPEQELAEPPAEAASAP